MNRSLSSRRFFAALLLLGLVLGTTSCRSHPAALSPPLPAGAASPKEGRSVEGRPIEVFVRGEGARTVLVLATIHGDEAAGTPLLRALVDRLNTAPAWMDGVRVVVVPVANPDGLARGTRLNARGVDLNRNFPAANRRDVPRHGAHALSEPESRFLSHLVAEFPPDRIVTFHQAMDLIDWDGPGEDLARAMAASSPLEARRIGSRPGSFGAWAGEDLGIPIITVELPRAADRLDAAAAWVEYGAMLRAALRF